ncbi:MAG: tetratricopeptide repeat protein, partial [Pseudomonadota bacterium]
MRQVSKHFIVGMISLFILIGSVQPGPAEDAVLQANFQTVLKLLQEGRNDAAFAAIKEGLSRVESVRDAEPLSAAQTIGAYAFLAIGRNQELTEAHGLVEGMIEVLKEQKLQDNGAFFDLLTQRANLAAALGDIDGAGRSFDKAVLEARSVPGPNNQWLGRTLAGAATFHFEGRRYEKAIPLANEAFKVAPDLLAAVADESARLFFTAAETEWE